MKIVINKEDLEEHVVDLLQKIPNNKLLLDHYLDGAIEAEADAICDGEKVQIIGIMEHIEPCGIHSVIQMLHFLHLIWEISSCNKLKITQKLL